MNDKVFKLLTSSSEDDVILGINFLLNDPKVVYNFQHMSRGQSVYTLPKGLKFKLYIEFIFSGAMFKTIGGSILKSNFLIVRQDSIYIYGKDD